MDLDEERLGESVLPVQEIDRCGLCVRTVLPPERSKHTRRAMFLRTRRSNHYFPALSFVIVPSFIMLSHIISMSFMSTKPDLFFFILAHIFS